MENVLPTISNSSDSIVVRNLLSVTRNVSMYGIDKKNRHFFSDEFLFNQIADCEDFSIFFVSAMNLYKETEYVFLEYSNHVNVGLKLNIKTGHKVKHKGVKYTVCEPTDPNDTFNIGETTDFEIQRILEGNTLK